MRRQPKEDGLSYGVHVRKTFDEASTQLTASIHGTRTNTSAGETGSWHGAGQERRKNSRKARRLRALR